MTSNVRSNFSKLLAGNVTIQILSLLFYPILTRIYSPTAFGTFGVFMSIVQITAIYSFGQLHTSLLTIKDHQERDEVFSLTLLLNLTSSIFLLFIYIILNSIGFIETVFLWVPVAIFFYSLMEIHKIWAVANGAIGKKTLIINLNRLLSNVFKLFGTNSISLILSEIATNAISSVIFFKYSKSSFSFSNLPRKFWNYLKKYKEFPLFYTLYVLAQVLGSEAVTLYLQKHLGTSDVGVFFLGNKLFVQTALIISSTLSFSFSSKLVQSTKDRNGIYSKSLIIYFIGIAFAFLLSLPDYKSMILLFFGEKWGDLAEVVRFFIFLTPIKIFVGFFAYIILLSGRTKFISFFKIGQFILLLSILQLGFEDLKSFLQIFVPFELIADTIFVLWGYTLIKRDNCF